MRSACCIPLVVGVLWLAGCGGPVSSQAVREQLATVSGASLDTDNVRVERIISQASGQVVADATVQMGALFEEDSEGEWNIIAIRIGEDEWIDLATFEAALAERRIAETTSDLQRLAAGVEAFEQEHGSLPNVSEADPLPDVLHPLFVSDLLRQDAWGSAFVYEPSADSIRLRSWGPDRAPGTPDDIEVTTRRRP